jgi:hypothetical protein
LLRRRLVHLLDLALHLVQLVSQRLALLCLSRQHALHRIKASAPVRGVVAAFVLGSRSNLRGRLNRWGFGCHCCLGLTGAFSRCGRLLAGVALGDRALDPFCFFKLTLDCFR